MGLRRVAWACRSHPGQLCLGQQPLRGQDALHLGVQGVQLWVATKVDEDMRLGIMEWGVSRGGAWFVVCPMVGDLRSAASLERDIPAFLGLDGGHSRATSPAVLVEFVRVLNIDWTRDLRNVFAMRSTGGSGM